MKTSTSIEQIEANTAEMQQLWRELKGSARAKATPPAPHTPLLRQTYPVAWAAVVAMAFSLGIGIGAWLL